MHNVAYLRISDWVSNAQYSPTSTIWLAISLACVTLITIAMLLCWELSQYGFLLRFGWKKDAASMFFNTLTGSIVYAHGKPKQVPQNIKRIVLLLADAAFLSITFQLLQSLACEWDEGKQKSLLQIDKSVECWTGNHAVMASIALICLSYYIPLSVMLAPVLVATQQEKRAEKLKGSNSLSNPVTFTRPYLMIISTTKIILLCFAVFLPGWKASTTASSVISLVLCLLTLLWINKHPPELYSDPQPCSIPMIASLKLLGYSLAVLSNILSLLASSFPQATALFRLMELQPILWIMLSIVLLYSHKKRMLRWKATWKVENLHNHVQSASLVSTNLIEMEVIDNRMLNVNLRGSWLALQSKTADYTAVPHDFYYCSPIDQLSYFEEDLSIADPIIPSKVAFAHSFRQAISISCFSNGVNYNDEVRFPSMLYQYTPLPPHPIVNYPLHSSPVELLPIARLGTWSNPFFGLPRCIVSVDLAGLSILKKRPSAFVFILIDLNNYEFIHAVQTNVDQCSRFTAGLKLCISIVENLQEDDWISIVSTRTIGIGLTRAVKIKESNKTKVKIL